MKGLVLALTLILILILSPAIPPLHAAPVLDIEVLAPDQFRLSWPAADTGFLLEESPALGPSAAWMPTAGSALPEGTRWSLVVASSVHPRFFRLVEASSSPAAITETSPYDGESGVSVHRETVFRFNQPLASDTLLDSRLISASAAGRPLLTRLELATDRRTATLFFLEPLPPSTRVQVRFDGFGVLDAQGRALDADHDGLPGGLRQLNFTTVPTQPVSHTAVRGRVLASQPHPDGSNLPIPGVTITVDGAEESLRTVTGPDGSFLLHPAPAGRFFVHIDGRTSPLSQWPSGDYYPFIGKAWFAEPGRTNLAHGDSDLIYLPLVPGDALQPVSATDTTTVTLSPSILNAFPELDGLEVLVPPNALFAENGSRGGRIGLAPVNPDRLPEPLPPGLNLPLVITIQTDGPANFDRPVPVRFPNLPDPVTGERLPPGAKSALWSFDHDTGRWEIAGPMTITPDGLFAVTDPGVGVRQPGWHGSAPGSPGGGPSGPGGGGGPFPDCPTCKDVPPRNPPDCNPPSAHCDPDCIPSLLPLATSLTDLFLDVGSAWVGEDFGPGCAGGIAIGASRIVRDCSFNLESCGDIDIANPIIDNAAGSALGCIPKVGSILAAGWTFKTVLFNLQNYLDCTRGSPQPTSLHAVIGGNASIQEILLRIEHLLHRQLALSEASSNLVASWFGPAWAVAQTPAHAATYAAFMREITLATLPTSPEGRLIAPAELAHLRSLPKPPAIDDPAVDDLVARFRHMASGNFRAGDPAADAFTQAFDHLESTFALCQAEGWVSLWDGLYRAYALLTPFLEPAPGSPDYPAWNHPNPNPNPSPNPSLQNPTPPPSLPDPAFPRRPHHFALLDLANHFLQRGRLSALGEFPPLILAPNRRYLVAYLDPLTGRLGTATFVSAPSGIRTRLPAAPLLPPPGPGHDRDLDDLSDRAEFILGSNPNLADTDGDGLNDGEEFHSGSQPLDGQPTTLGVIAGIPLPGTTYDVAIEAALAAVASGTSGLSLVDLSNPIAPVLLSQIQLPRTRAVALSAGIVLAGHASGATLIDARVPSTPVVLTNFSGSVVPTVAIAGQDAYFAQGTRVHHSHLRFLTPTPSLNLDQPIHALAVDGPRLHVLTATDLHIFQRQGADLTPLSLFPVSFGVTPRETGLKLFVGGGRAYVGGFQGFVMLDVSQPDQPRLLAEPPVTQAAIHGLADNGSGRLAAITSFAGTDTLSFSLYDVSSGLTTTNFLTSLPTGGDPYTLTLHRGLAFVADGQQGLKVIRYLPPDSTRQSPSIAFSHPLSTSPTLELGSYVLFTFQTRDDVQVRDVELYADTTLLGRSGSFPFQFPIAITPPPSGSPTASWRARAVDTAGNERWTDPFEVQFTPDQSPPTLRFLAPGAGSEAQPGALLQASVAFSEPMNPNSVSSGFQLAEAGPDGSLGTADDRLLAPEITYHPSRTTADVRLNPAFPTGRYRLTALPSLTDASGIQVTSPLSREFRVLPPTVVSVSPGNNSSHRPGAPSQITARFSTLMDAPSLRAGGFLLLHAGPDGQSGTADDIPTDVSSLTFSSISNRLIFNPNPPLPSGRYRASFTTQALDVLGNRLSPPNPTSFTIASPSILAIDPPDGHARPLASLSEISLRFSDPMNPGTFAHGFQVALTNGSPITIASTRYDPNTLTGTLVFPEALPGGAYRLQALTSITDAFGNPLATPFSSRFSVHGPVQWAVDADGRWDVAAHWTPARPIPGDDVILNRPAGVFTVTHTTGHLLVSTLQAAENLTLTGGSLTLRSNSVLDATLSLRNASLTNLAQLQVNHTLTLHDRGRLEGPGPVLVLGQLQLAGGSLANGLAIGDKPISVPQGTVSWLSGNVGTTGFGGPTRWSIGPQALFETLGSSARRDWFADNGTLHLHGTWRHSGPTNLLAWQSLHITNAGLWDIQSGHAQIEGSILQSGRLSLAPNTSLRVLGSRSHSFNLLPNGRIDGQGNLTVRQANATLSGAFALEGITRFESANVTWTGPLTSNLGPLEFINADTLFDQGPLTLHAPITHREGTLHFHHPTTLNTFHWNFGEVIADHPLTLQLPLTIGDPAIGNDSTFLGPGPLRILQDLTLLTRFALGPGALLELSGTCTWHPRVASQLAGIQCEANSIFRLLPTAHFILATNRNVSGPGTFDNQGSLTKAANLLTNELHVPFLNSGTLTVLDGRLRLSGGGELGGLIHLAPPATLEIRLANPRPDWLLSGSFSGAGQLLVGSATNHFTGSLAGPHLIVSNALAFHLHSPLTLTNTHIHASQIHLHTPLTLLTGNASRVSGNTTRFDGTGQLRNQGSLTDSGALWNVEVENAGQWTHLGSSLQQYAASFRNLPGATLTISNITTSPTATTPRTGSLDNAGHLLHLGSGNARLLYALTNRGTLQLSSGSLLVDAPFTQTPEGLTLLHHGRLSPIAPHRILAGEIHGPGTVGRSPGSSGSYALTNSAHLKPGGPSNFGILTFDASSVRLTQDSQLTVRLAGAQPGIDHDQFQVTGSVILAGSLHLQFLPPFAPAVGDRFRILTASSRTGTFASPPTLSGLPAGLTARLLTLPNGLEVEIIPGS